MTMLIEPIKVTIQQINKTATQFSGGVSGRREIVNHVARNAAIVVDAQVAFGNTDNMPQYSAMGVDEAFKGYLILDRQDLIKKGITFQRGDKITKLGDMDVELYLIHGNGDPAAHFSGIGGFTITKLFFSDKVPKA